MKAEMLKGVLQLIKLIALDLDGTLLTGEKKITEENKKAIKLAKENGIKVVLCTGRPIVSIVHLLEELDLMGEDDYAINFNGGLIHIFNSMSCFIDDFSMFCYLN